MKHKIGPAVLALAALFSGCSTLHTQPAWESIKDKTAALSQNLRPSAQPQKQTSTSLLKTPLLGALSRNPSSDGRTPEWPKVVITDLEIPADQQNLGRSLSLRPDECIKFNAILWNSASDSQRFDKLRLCADQLPKQSNNFVLTWKSFSIPGETTGQVRTDGPRLRQPSCRAAQPWTNG